jgi:predicted TIM-barrel fold metal-dependent hydrolase
VVELAAPYSGWLDQARELVAHLSESERALILGDVARSFYRLRNEPPSRGQGGSTP